MEQKRDSLPYSKNEKIYALSLSLSGAIFLVMLALCLGLLAPILLVDSLATSSSLILSCLSIAVFLIGSVISSFSTIIIFKKILKFLSQKSYKNIVNSQEYQSILGQVEELEEQKTHLLNKEMVKKYDFELADSNFTINETEILRREAFIKFIENGTQTEETTVAKKRVRTING